MNEAFPTSTIPPKTSKKFTFSRLILTMFVLALVAGLAVTGYLYYQTKEELRMLTTESGQEELAKREREAVEGKLKRLTILPDEEPVIATIIDPDFLASQSAFYNNSLKGDKLVVYPQAQKAFIYSPERDLIVNSGPLIVEPQEGLEQTPPDASSRIQIEVRNGSIRAGAGTELSQSLNKERYQVLQVTDATNKEYAETLVVNNKSNLSAEQLNALATEVGGRVVTALPTGEIASSAQVVVIVGAE